MNKLLLDNLFAINAQKKKRNNKYFYIRSDETWDI